MNSRDVVLDFFSRNAKTALPERHEDALACHYLDAGLIDSLGIVLMVSELEDKLGVALSSEDMQSYEFQTVGGLIGIFERLTAKKT
jgi:acyl carrier protein